MLQETDTLRVNPRLCDTERERMLDWLTALLPLWLISFLYFGAQALALQATAVGGYLMAALLLGYAVKTPAAFLRVAHAMPVGLLAAFCLPAGAAWWLSALMGGLAAGMDVLPSLVSRVRPSWHLARPLVHPVLTAFLLARLVFPAQFARYTMPEQYIPLDGVSGATPLAALQSGNAVEWWKLLFGIHAGAVGEICAAAILLGALYLILRRRLRLVAPACLLATVALLSWILWGAIGWALYALLGGGLLLAALLFADNATAPAAPRDQIVIGVFAGVITVLIRRFGGWTEGVAVGVLAAQILVPFLPFVYKISGIVWAAVSRWARAAWCWAKPYFFRFAGAKIAAIWRRICRGAKALLARITTLLKKRKNNS